MIGVKGNLFACGGDNCTPCFLFCDTGVLVGFFVVVDGVNNTDEATGVDIARVLLFLLCCCLGGVCGVTNKDGVSLEEDIATEMTVDNKEANI